MQMIIKTSRQCRADSCDLCQIRNARAHDPLQPTEVLEQRTSLRRPQSWNRLQYGFVVAPGALAPVSRYGKAMRLIADPLYQARGRCVRLRCHGAVRAPDEQPLLSGAAIGSLGNAHE